MRSLRPSAREAPTNYAGQVFGLDQSRSRTRRVQQSWLESGRNRWLGPTRVL